MKADVNRLKPLLNHGESIVLGIAQAMCDATGTKAFAKMRIADVVTIENSGLSDELYRFALSAHFDVLVSKGNRAFLAIEFDGKGHDSRNDVKKGAICARFGIPLVMVKESHLNAKIFGDTAVGFFIWQLFCVDVFLEQHGSDPYEPYDPAWFVSVPGKDRQWPFAYAERWRGRLAQPFQEAESRFDATVRDFYSHGILQFGTVTFTCRRELEYRSIYAQLVGSDRVVMGEAELALDVCGLEGRRYELFGEIASFVEGFAAERMYQRAIKFLNREEDSSPLEIFNQRVAMWQREGFRLRRGLNLPSSTHISPLPTAS